MYRCEELFYYGLTSSESIEGIEPSSNNAYDGKLLIDYDKAEGIGMNLQRLLENECDLFDLPENSQMGCWSILAEEFHGQLKHGKYDPEDYMENVKLELRRLH